MFVSRVSNEIRDFFNDKAETDSSKKRMSEVIKFCVIAGTNFLANEYALRDKDIHRTHRKLMEKLDENLKEAEAQRKDSESNETKKKNYQEIVNKIMQIIKKNSDFGSFMQAGILINDYSAYEEKKDKLLRSAILLGYRSMAIPESIHPLELQKGKYRFGSKEKVERFLELAYADSDAIIQVAECIESEEAISDMQQRIEQIDRNITNLKKLKGILGTKEMSLVIERMGKISDLIGIIVPNRKPEKGAMWKFSKSVNPRDIESARDCLETEVEEHRQLTAENPKYKSAYNAYVRLLKSDKRIKPVTNDDIEMRRRFLKKYGIEDYAAVYASFDSKVQAELKAERQSPTFDRAIDHQIGMMNMSEAVTIVRKRDLEEKVKNSAQRFSHKAYEYARKYTPEELKFARDVFINWKDETLSELLQTSPVSDRLSIELLYEMEGMEFKKVYDTLKSFNEFPGEYKVEPEALGRILNKKVNDMRIRAYNKRTAIEKEAEKILERSIADSYDI